MSKRTGVSLGDVLEEFAAAGGELRVHRHATGSRRWYYRAGSWEGTVDFDEPVYYEEARREVERRVGKARAKDAVVWPAGGGE